MEPIVSVTVSHADFQKQHSTDTKLLFLQNRNLQELTHVTHIAMETKIANTEAGCAATTIDTITKVAQFYIQNKNWK